MPTSADWVMSAEVPAPLSNQPPTQPLALDLRAVTKRFGAVLANDAVRLQVATGSIHGIVGENGAGKSTLMGLLMGLHQPDSGEMWAFGSRLQVRSPKDASDCGIGMVHQHFMLVERFTVLENILLGMEGGARLLAGERAVRLALKRFASEFNLHVNPDALAGNLSLGERQRLEIIKVLHRSVRLLVLDEPTAVLSPTETEQLFVLLRRLQARGTTIVLISHKLKEIMAVTQAVTVMRQGRVVTTVATRDTDAQALAHAMVGRAVATGRPPSTANPGPELLRIEQVSTAPSAAGCCLESVNLQLHAGEIVGVAGIAGNGQAELMAVLAGLQVPHSGRVRIMGAGSDVGSDVQKAEVPPTHPTHPTPLTLDAKSRPDPARMRRLGIGHVPIDRQAMGMVMAFPAWETAALGFVHEARYQPRVWLRRWGGLSGHAMRQDCKERMQAFDVRPPDPQLASAAFSGGNQQKLVLARELERRPRVLLVGEPTRGVDVGAIEFIHAQLRALRDAGSAVLLVSSELDELLALADRIVVMVGGRLVAELSAQVATEQALGTWMVQTPRALAEQAPRSVPAQHSA